MGNIAVRQHGAAAFRRAANSVVKPSCVLENVAHLCAGHPHRHQSVWIDVERVNPAPAHRAGRKLRRVCVEERGQRQLGAGGLELDRVQEVHRGAVLEPTTIDPNIAGDFARRAIEGRGHSLVGKGHRFHNLGVSRRVFGRHIAPRPVGDFPAFVTLCQNQINTGQYPSASRRL